MEENNSPVRFNKRMPEWQLKIAYFYTRHKIAIKRGLIFAVFFIDVLVVFIFASTFINYKTGLIKDKAQLQFMHLNLVDRTALEKNRPQDLELNQTTAIPTVNNNYHLVARVKNKNKEWAATKLFYRAVNQNGENQQYSTFMLPYSQKYIFAFNQPEARFGEIEVINESWQRIENFNLISYKDKIEVNNPEFNTVDSNLFYGKLKAEIYNATPYDFWRVGLQVVIFNRQDEIIGIDYLTLDKFKSRETRTIDINWTDPIRENERIGQIEIIPEVNLLDRDVIMPLSPSGSSPPKLIE